MKRRHIHANSLAAYWSGQEGLFGKRELDVLLAIKAAGTATDREVMLALGFQDPNAVRPRITELVKLGILEEAGACIEDVMTGRWVRKVRIKADPRQPQREFDLGPVAELARRIS